MRILDVARKGIKGCWFYFWGHLLGLCFYDAKFLKGKWFEGRMNGICAIGWEWVVKDAVGRLIFGENKYAKFPISQHCRVICPENIHFDTNDLNNFQSFGIYYQSIGEIYIGKGTFIGPNVGLITANHDAKDPNKHLPPKTIVLGEKCWIGMNSVILGGVILGPHTTVGAGSVVTKSFPEGKCIIAGNPARIIKYVDVENDE